MRLALTGAQGFLGWHFRCLALSRGHQVVPISQTSLHDGSAARALATVDAVVHAAGVNRGSDEEVTEGNLRAASALRSALEDAGSGAPIIYANSIQADLDNTYGRAKAGAAEILAGSFSTRLEDCLLPNLFGEHGRPSYNSFVATFCHQIARGVIPEVHEDRSVPLLHVQQACEILLAAAVEGPEGVRRRRVDGRSSGVGEVLTTLQVMADAYQHGEIPHLPDAWHLQLFNTYRSFAFPGNAPFASRVHSDSRGDLFECVRSGASQAQVFVSSTVAGATRGEHFHLHKVERFFVLRGAAEISLRRLFTREVVRFRVDGSAPMAVDMPTMWVHKIKNIGSSPVQTLFWANELLDPNDTDTYPSVTDAAEELA